MLCIIDLIWLPPPICLKTSPRVSFVGEVFFTAPPSAAISFLSVGTQEGGFGGIQVVELDPAQLRLCRFIKTFHVKSHRRNDQSWTKIDQINQQTVKVE